MGLVGNVRMEQGSPVEDLEHLPLKAYGVPCLREPKGWARREELDCPLPVTVCSRNLAADAVLDAVRYSRRYGCLQPRSASLPRAFPVGQLRS